MAAGNAVLPHNSHLPAFFPLSKKKKHQSHRLIIIIILINLNNDVKKITLWHFAAIGCDRGGGAG